MVKTRKKEFTNILKNYIIDLCLIAVKNINYAINFAINSASFKTNNIRIVRKKSPLVATAAFFCEQIPIKPV